MVNRRASILPGTISGRNSVNHSMSESGGPADSCSQPAFRSEPVSERCHRGIWSDARRAREMARRKSLAPTLSKCSLDTPKMGRELHHLATPGS